jgi:hypothetical protein
MLSFIDGKVNELSGGFSINCHGFLIPGEFPDVIQKPRNHPHQPPNQLPRIWCYCILVIEKKNEEKSNLSLF